MTFNEFLELRDMLTVVHHIPGRLRLRLDPEILMHPAAGTLRNLHGAIGRGPLISVRLNPFARSLLLEYDPEQLAAGAVEDFLVSGDAERVSQLAETVAKLFGIELQSERENGNER